MHVLDEDIEECVNSLFLENAGVLGYGMMQICQDVGGCSWVRTLVDVGA